LGLPSAEQRNKNMALIATAIITLAFVTAHSAYAINHYISSNANPIAFAHFSKLSFIIDYFGKTAPGGRFKHTFKFHAKNVFPVCKGNF